MPLLRFPHNRLLSTPTGVSLHKLPQTLGRIHFQHTLLRLRPLLPPLLHHHPLPLLLKRLQMHHRVNYALNTTLSLEIRTHSI